MNLNIQNWEEFSLGRLFTIYLPKGDIKLDQMNPGSIPLVSSGSTNNGIIGYIDSAGDGKSEIISGNKITLDMFGNCFYQKGAFYSVSHGRVNILDPKFDLNEYIALFIATVVGMEQYKFSYGRAIYRETAKNITIKLPIQYDGNNDPVINYDIGYNEYGYIPDFEFMENYIKSLHYEQLTTQVRSNGSLKYDTNTWEKFRFGDLLSDIYKAEAHVKIDMNTYDEPFENSMHFISRTEINNGCDCYVKNENLTGVENGNAIVIGDTTATCSYQADKFICGDHMVVCRAKWLDLYTGLFIVTLLKKEKYRYSYGRAFNMPLIENTILKLPVKDKTPDWERIKDFMKKLPYSDRLV